MDDNENLTNTNIDVESVVSADEIATINKEKEQDGSAPLGTTNETVEEIAVKEVEQTAEAETEAADVAEVSEEQTAEAETETTDEATEERQTTEDEITVDGEQMQETEDDDTSADKEEDNTPFVVDNIDDSQMLADEVGISNIFDAYGREVLEPVFENILRLSTNSVKLAYSRIKNTIMAHRDVKQRYSGSAELFKKSNKILCRMEIGMDCINLYLALNPDELDKDNFIFSSAKSIYKQTPTRVTVLKGDKKSGEVYLSAIGLVEKVMSENYLQKSKFYVPVAYAERYPFNPYAVLKGEETIPPVEGKYDGEEYDYIEGELNKNIIDELMGEEFNLEEKQGRDKLDALRQQAETIKGAIALHEPIIYYYDNAMNKEDNKPAFINVQQVLQDKFMGKVLPPQYYAVAESSNRIEELNLLTVKEIVQNANDNPTLFFGTKISCRLLTKEASFERLIKCSKSENNNIILAFDCAYLEAIGKKGKDNIEKLKANGVSIMIDNTENASMRMITECIIDYLRFDARYYIEENPRATAHLDIMTGYSKIQGIKTVAEYTDSIKSARHLMQHGVEIIQGFVVQDPKRTIHAAVKEAKKLPMI